MNIRFAPAVFLALCCLASGAGAGTHGPGAGHENAATAPRGTADDAQRRRADLRAALQTQQFAGNQSSRQLSVQDRAELRQQLRQQRP
ncbi:MAG: hypothetical protein KGN32_10120 [Burkholderiales bacterium]|nr:hypothetical protein [Burkholderiales bacterium]